MNVSVVIAAYNASSTIADTLKSLQAQTSPEWEAIVVNDGSTDETGAIVRAFASRDERIRLVSQENRGESGARNTGIEHATRDWLLFLDADDWIAPDHLERMTAALEADPHLDAVHCLSVRVAADGTHVVDPYEPPAGDMFPTLAKRAAFPVHACIVRKALVEAVGTFDTSLRKSPDWDLWQRVARTGAQFGAVREVLAFYRMQPQSASLAAEQLLRDGLTVLERGHGSDPRVRNPLPDHANGAPAEERIPQQFYLLTWCAGILIGQGRSAAGLMKIIPDVNCPGLYADAIGQIIFEAAPLPSCRRRTDWEALWPDFRAHVEEFLAALEAQSHAPELAASALVELKQRILRASPTWGAVIARNQERVDELERRVVGLDEERARQQVRAESAEGARDASAVDLQRWRDRATAHERTIADLERECVSLEQQQSALERRIEQAEHEWRAFELQRWIRVGKRLNLLASRPPLPDSGERGVRWGDLRRVTPISSVWGLDRGGAIDRHYIEQFLHRHCEDIKGRTLEVKDGAYTTRFGTGVTQSDVLDVNPENPLATIVADLTHADTVPSDTFDCFILTQTLHQIFDMRAALRHAHRILKPGGVLLCTFPSLTRVDAHTEPHGDRESDFWRVTRAAVANLIGEQFRPGSFDITGVGSVLTCVAFLYGLAPGDLTHEELDVVDPWFPLLYCVRAVKAETARV